MSFPHDSCSDNWSRPDNRSRSNNGNDDNDNENEDHENDDDEKTGNDNDNIQDPNARRLRQFPNNIPFLFVPFAIFGDVDGVWLDLRETLMNEKKSEKKNCKKAEKRGKNKDIEKWLNETNDSDIWTGRNTP